MEKKKCGYEGPLVTNKLGNKCRWVNLGGNKKRKQCCGHKKECKHTKKSKKCTKSGRKCEWKSPVIKIVVKSNCAFEKAVKGLRRRVCCAVTYECSTPEGKTKESCKPLAKKCKATKSYIKTNKHKSCNWRTVGTNGRRRRCCEWHHHCVKDKKKKEKCSIQNRRCYWDGCTKYTEVKGKCQWRHRTKHVKQRLCCEYTQSCQCGKCVKSQKKCHWRGNKIKIVKHKKCHWKTIGTNGKRKECCHHSKKCFGKECSKTKKCKWASELITFKEFTKCHWKHITKNSKRRNCCVYTKRCIGKKCQSSKLRCKLAGYVVVERNGKNCTLEKYKGGSKRLKCCSFIKSCKVTGKGKPVCNHLKKKCKFTGKKKWYFKRKSTVWAKYEKKGTMRRRECEWVDYCIGSKKKCTPTKKVCKFVGKIRQTHVESQCWFKKRGKNSKQRRCCTKYLKCECDKLDDKSNCKVHKKTCKWLGNRITITHKQKCFTEAVGKNSSRLKCCHHTKKCSGNKVNCKTKVHSCKFKGPLHTFKSQSSCKFQSFGEGKRNHCCTTITKCIVHKKKNKECKEVSKKCAFTGPYIRIRKSKHCIFKTVGSYKQRFCCNKVTHHHDGKVHKAVSKCYFTGTKIPIETKYFKKVHTSKKSKYHTTFCTKLYACKRLGSVEKGCAFVKNVECKVVHKVKHFHTQTCRMESFKKGHQLCERKKCTKRFYKQVGNNKPQETKITTHWDGAEKCRNHIVVVKRCRTETFSKGCRQERCCDIKMKNSVKTDETCYWKGARVCPVLTKCHQERSRRKVGKRTVIFVQRKCCKGDTCWLVGRAVADPHLTPLSGRGRVEEPYAGTFKYFYYNGCKVQVQFSQAHTDSVITGVATQCNGNKKDFLLTTNFPSKEFKVNYSGNEGFELGDYRKSRQGAKRKLADGTTKEIHFTVFVVELKGARIEIVYDETGTNTITINIAVDTNVNLAKASGLIVGDPKSTKDAATGQIISRVDSLFNHYIEFKELVPQETGSDVYAKECCTGVDANQMKECVHDVKVTKLDWGALYQAERIALTEIDK